MTERFLEIVSGKSRARAAIAVSYGYLPKLRGRAEKLAEERIGRPLYDALSRSDRINIIGEFKRASPSRGLIRADADPVQVATHYEQNGAAAVSVLTESEYFDGSMSDLAAVVGSISIPTLRKDFIVDEYQIVEAAAAGAAAILLIVAALSLKELKDLAKIARDLRIDVLVEVHSIDEMHKAADIGADVIGVNNRDLQTLAVSLDMSRKLIDYRPTNALLVAESGISGRAEIDELSGLGYNAFLIGEAVMREPALLKELLR